MAAPAPPASAGAAALPPRKGFCALGCGKGQPDPGAHPPEGTPHQQKEAVVRRGDLARAPERCRAVDRRSMRMERPGLTRPIHAVAVGTFACVRGGEAP